MRAIQSRNGGLAILACAGFLASAHAAAGQRVAPPVAPITVAPVAPVPIPVVPGAGYTFHLPQTPDLGKVIDVTTSAPGVTITSLPDGPDGSVQREVQVAGSAPPGSSTVRVVGERGQTDVPLVVVPPSPPEMSGPDPGDGDDAADGGGLLRLLAVLIVGVFLGLLFGRKKLTR